VAAAKPVVAVTEPAVAAVQQFEMQMPQPYFHSAMAEEQAGQSQLSVAVVAAAKPVVAVTEPAVQKIEKQTVPAETVAANWKESGSTASVELAGLKPEQVEHSLAHELPSAFRMAAVPLAAEYLKWTRQPFEVEMEFQVKRPALQQTEV
jgi:hypothetical protein